MSCSHTMLSAASADFRGKLKLGVTPFPTRAIPDSTDPYNRLKASQGGRSEPNPRYSLQIITAIRLTSACGDADEFPLSHLIQDGCAGVRAGRSCLQRGSVGSG